MIKTYFLDFDDDGSITGIYNTVDHPQAPLSRMFKTDRSIVADVVRRPNDFKIITTPNGLRLQDSEVSIGSGSVQVHTQTFNYLSGFMFNDICFLADNESSAHATQCLLLASTTKADNFKLKTTDGQSTSMTSVTVKDLEKIVRGINELRSGGF